MKNDLYMRNCPKCGKEIYHTTKHILNQSIKGNRICKSCSKMFTNNPNFNTHFSDERKNKISKSCSIDRINRYSDKRERDKLSKSQIKRYSNEEQKKNTSIFTKTAMRDPKIRKKHLDALHNSQWLKVKTDEGQLELIENLNSIGFNFQPNFQVKTNQDLFYIDGYDKEKNVVLEYDSKYHNRRQQKEKDLVRQQKIIEILKPKKFWRYDGVTKSFTEVIGENKL
jgi:hypothetical protein